MMKKPFFVLFLSLAALGCSDSTSTPPNTYPLQLAQLAEPQKPQGATKGVYSLQVSRSGSVLKGAKLIVVGYPSNKTDTIRLSFNGAALLSDSVGAFNFVYDWGSSASVAFQAVKDSLVSNYVKY